MRERLVTFRAQRLNRAMAMVERLNQLGARLKTEDVLALAGPGVVGRPHVAAVLVKSGQAESIDDAFRRFLGRDGQAFVPRPAFRPDEAIALIHAAGGISVLAHAGAAMSDQTIEGAGGHGAAWHRDPASAAQPGHGATLSRAGGEALLLETGGSDSPRRGPERRARRDPGPRGRARPPQGKPPASPADVPTLTRDATGGHAPEPAPRPCHRLCKQFSPATLTRSRARR